MAAFLNLALANRALSFYLDSNRHMLVTCASKGTGTGKIGSLALPVPERI